MSTTIKVDLNDPDQLNQLPEKMKEAALEALLQQAHVMAGLAQVYAPVDTGSLRDSIRVERGGEGQYWATVRVRAGGYIVNPKTGRFVDYAVYVEEQTGFMASAYADAFQGIEQQITSFLLPKV